MPDETPPPEAPPKPKKKLPLTLLIVVGVALGEAGAFFAVFHYLGRGPAPAYGEGGHAVSSQPAGEAKEEAKPAEEKGEGKASESKEGEGEGEGEGKKEGAAPAAAVSVTGLGEVIVLKNFRVPNNKGGRLYIYDMDVSIVVAAGDKERLEKVIKERSGEISDTVAQIMRRATERTLTEDDLRALRHQLREGLLEIIKDEKLVQRVLIPRFVPIRAD
jgi:flagellar basal body-associated protein FliL